MSATHELLNDAAESGQPEMEGELISCPRDVLRDFAGMVAPKIGVKVLKRKPVDLSANGTAGGISAAEVFEWVNAVGEVVARKVTALGQVETWLRADLATDTLIARSDERAEHLRIIDTVAKFIKDTDEAGAKRHGITVEQYRIQRHNAGAGWDHYRARNRAGGL